MALLKTQVKNIVPQCQVVVLKWKYEDTDGLSNLQLSDTSILDISRYVQGVSFQKNMSSPAGQFQITLPNDRDWKDVVKKGTWCLIYMSNDGDLAIPSTDRVPSIPELLLQRSKLRCLGYIDTVRAQGTVGSDNGEFDVQYLLSGRDFGIVYEETDIWHNQFAFDGKILETINNKIQASGIKTVDKLLDSLHDLFFAPDKIVTEFLKNDSLTSVSRQWLLPSSLFALLGMIPTGLGSYYGNIPGVKNFRPTKATYPVESPTGLLNGIAWDRLKAHSIEPYHELFPELNDNGQPQLNFRVIPWRITNNRSLFPTIFSTMDKFASDKNGIVDINNIDILSWDLGEDNHTRYNLFWSTINTSQVNIQTSAAMSGDTNPTTGFPRILQESIKRHGLRKLFSEVNANIVIGSEKADPKLIKEFNELALEFWGKSHKYESGTMSIIGNTEIRLGKCVHIEVGAQYHSNKFFYIEGYEDSFIVNDNGASEWTQTLFLTRGTATTSLILVNNDDYKNSGVFIRK
jgi:hypothetical protein